jgi:hypothetical protein
MRRGLLFAALALGAGGCFVGTLDLANFACDNGSHPCANGYSCVFGPDGGGTCVVQGSGTSSSSSSGGTTSGGSSSGSSGPGPCNGVPTCATSRGLLLCDGGVTPCGSGLACDYGACVSQCSGTQTCDAGAICDTSVNACVLTQACSDGGGCPVGAFCGAGVCMSAPPVGSSVGACTLPDGGGMVLVEGPVALFPLRNAAATLEDGGTVTFFNDTQTLKSVPIVPEPTGTVHVPSYSINVPVGTWTALVQQAGVLPTYFPGIEVQSSEVGSSAQVSLETVVALDSLPSFPGVTPQAGHIYWVGLATDCALSGFLGGYTVGLSPAAPELGFIGSGLGLDPSLTSSSSLGYGEFFAVDAPYAVTQYTLALGLSSGSPIVLMSGTFTPPTFSPGQTIAVALIYPNFTQ